MWKRAIGAAALAGLVGCAAPTLEDRLKNPPDYRFSSNRTVEEVANCMQSAWVVKYPAEVVAIPQGKRLVHAGAVTVEQVFDVTSTPVGSTVTAYVRTPRGYWAPKLIEDVKGCL